MQSNQNYKGIPPCISSTGLDVEVRILDFKYRDRISKKQTMLQKFAKSLQSSLADSILSTSSCGKTECEKATRKSTEGRCESCHKVGWSFTNIDKSAC